MHSVTFTANARPLGSRQTDAIQRVTGTITDMAAGATGAASGVFTKTRDVGTIYSVNQVAGYLRFMDVVMSLSAGARTSDETRPMNVAYHPRIHA
ncbi:hypothetical protein ACOTHJ_33375 [Achromobacter xylosoxidans]